LVLDRLYQILCSGAGSEVIEAGLGALVGASYTEADMTDYLVAHPEIREGLETLVKLHSKCPKEVA